LKILNFIIKYVLFSSGLKFQLINTLIPKASYILTSISEVPSFQSNSMHFVITLSKNHLHGLD